MVSMSPSEPSSEREGVVEFVSMLTGEAPMRIEENLPHGFVRLKVAEAQRRQALQDIRCVEDVVTELARNSRDAGAGRVLVGFQKERGRYRKVVVLDDGCGIPEDMHAMVFEPRVTSKHLDFNEDRYGVHGRGMALFSIKSRAMDAQVVSSRPGQGSAVSVLMDTREVPERSDQATLPALEESEDGGSVGAGPHNAARVLLEMSVDHPEVEFFIGSFAEVVATAKKLADEAPGESPWSALSGIDDAGALADFSRDELGMPVSERNAYRVLKDEVAPLVTVLSLAAAVPRSSASPVAREGVIRRRGGASRTRTVRVIAPEDVSEIGRGCAEAVREVLGRYYLETVGEPRVRRGRGKIVVSVFITGEEGERQ